MKAVTFMQFGGPDVLQITEQPTPNPQPGEVIVQVAACSVNPTDIAFLNGTRAPSDLRPPYVAGMDFSCIGSPESPLSDKDIEEKFTGQASLAIGQARAEALVKACWNVDRIAKVADLTGLAC